MKTPNNCDTQCVSDLVVPDALSKFVVSPRLYSRRKKIVLLFARRYTYMYGRVSPPVPQPHPTAKLPKNTRTRRTHNRAVLVYTRACIYNIYYRDGFLRGRKCYVRFVRTDAVISFIRARTCADEKKNKYNRDIRPRLLARYFVLFCFQ